MAQTGLGRIPTQRCEGSSERTRSLSHSDRLFPFYVFAFIPHAVILKMKWTESRRSLRCFFIFLFETKHTSDSEETAFSIFSLPEDLCLMLVGNEFWGLWKESAQSVSARQ